MARKLELWEDVEFVNEWLSKTKQQFQSDNAILTTNHQTRSSVWIALLRELIVTNRWRCVPEVLANLFISVDFKSDLDFKKTLQSLIIEISHRTTPEKSLQLRKIICFMRPFHKTLQLSHLKEGLAKGDISGQVPYTMPSSLCNPELNDTLIQQGKAYDSLVAYIKWKLECDKMKSGEKHNSQLIEELGELLCLNFGELSDGVSDIYITKHVELLEHSGKTKEAAELLRDNAKRQPYNFFAQRFLYDFLKKNRYPEIELVDVLKEVVRLSPWDDLALELYSLYKKLLSTSETSLSADTRREMHAHACTLLFDLLDYPLWKDDIRVWEYLCDEVKRAMKRCDGCDAVGELWESREVWWREYHFSNKSPQIKNVTARKIIVAALLLGKEDPLVDPLIAVYIKMFPDLSSVAVQVALNAENYRCRHVHVKKK